MSAPAEGRLHDTGRAAPRVTISPLQQSISSCSGALITSVFVTPLDVVKIRLQAQQKPFTRGSCFIYSNGLMDCLCVCSYCANNNGNGAAHTTLKPQYVTGARFTGTVRDLCRYHKMAISSVSETYTPRCQPPSTHLTGTLDAFIKITRYEGIASLWSGLPPTLVMAVPATVVYFTSYDHLKYKLGYKEGDPKTKYIPVVAGSMARVLASVLISPLELVRTKMQSARLSYSELGQAIRFTIQQHGFMAIMRGLGPSLLRDVPFSGLYWFGYEYTKSKHLQRTGQEKLSFPEAFSSGALAGTIAAVLTLPFDVIKTHRQIELGESEMLKNKEVSSTWKLIHRLYAQQGFSALFTGIVPRIVKVAPACAIMIGTYEYCKQFFHDRNLLATQPVHDINN